MTKERKSALVTVPSDAFRALLNLRDEFPALRHLMEEIIQIVMVLDASAVQRELRWRLRWRINPTARSGLHEVIDCGLVIAVAPVFLKQEIEKYLPVIACKTGVSVETANIEWEHVQSLIRFYTPNGDGTEFALVDPKDSPYALTARELDADFVRTTDKHFEKMGMAVAGPELDVVLRDYARSTTVLVTAKLGSGFAITFSLAAFVETVRGLVKLIRKLPPLAKLMLCAGVVIPFMHPKSRQKLMQWSERTWERILEAKPELISPFQKATKYLAEEAEISKTTHEEIKSKLRARGKQTALSHIRQICLQSSRPLTANEIAQRVLANGYPSRSKTFAAYVRRLLKEDNRFVANAEGRWAFRTAA
jgi:hypothetical protein